MDTIAEQIYAAQQQLIIAYAAALLLWSKSFPNGNYADAGTTISTVAQVLNIDPKLLNSLSAFLAAADDPSQNVGSTLATLNAALLADNHNLVDAMATGPQDVPPWSVGRPCPPEMAYSLTSAVGDSMPPGIQIRLNNLATTIAEAA